jgi:hypothetical protein
MSRLEILDKYQGNAIGLKQPSEGYWEKDAELCAELARENEKTRESLRPSPEALARRFTV